MEKLNKYNKNLKKSNTSNIQQKNRRLSLLKNILVEGSFSQIWIIPKFEYLFKEVCIF